MKRSFAGIDRDGIHASEHAPQYAAAMTSIS